MKKLRVKYWDSGWNAPREKVISFSSWYSVANDLSVNGIFDYQVISIEIVVVEV